MFGSAHLVSTRSRRIIAACAGTLLALLLGACAAEPAEPTVTPTIAPPAIAKEGVLTVGVNLGSAPYATEVDGGAVAGLDAEFADELAKNLGLKAEFVKVDPDGVADALASGSVDLVMSTPIDSVEATFVGSYLSAGPALYAAPSVTGEVSGSAVGDEVVAVQQDSPAYWWFTQKRGEDSVKVYGTAAEALEAVASGGVTYAAVDSVVGAYAVTAGVAVRQVGWVTEPADLGIAVRLDNTELAQAISAQFATLDGAGWIETLVRRWLVPLAGAQGSGDAEATSAP